MKDQRSCSFIWRLGGTAVLPFSARLAVSDGPALQARTGARISGLAICRSAPGHLFVGLILVCAGLDHGLENLLVGLDVIGADVPLLAVPGLDTRCGRAHVVGARGAERAHHTAKTQRIELL